MIRTGINRVGVAWIDGHGIEIAQFFIAQWRDALPGLAGIRRAKHAADGSGDQHRSVRGRAFQGPHRFPIQPGKLPGFRAIRRTKNSATRIRLLIPDRRAQTIAVRWINQQPRDHSVSPATHTAAQLPRLLNSRAHENVSVRRAQIKRARRRHHQTAFRAKPLPRLRVHAGLKSNRRQKSDNQLQTTQTTSSTHRRQKGNGLPGLAIRRARLLVSNIVPVTSTSHSLREALFSTLRLRGPGRSQRDGWPFPDPFRWTLRRCAC